MLKDRVRDALGRRRAGRRSAVLAVLALVAFLAVVEVLALRLVAG